MNIVRKAGAGVLWLNQSLWKRLPEKLRAGRLGLAWGRFIFSLVGLQGRHVQLTTTYFFRNRAELRLLGEICAEMTGSIRLTVVGCSEGAEVFSILHTVKKNNPALSVQVLAFDISAPALEIARKGSFSRSSRLFRYADAAEIGDLFEQSGDILTVRKSYQDGIDWRLEDPTREPAHSTLPGQDIVFINRLLFHMSLPEAERSLRAAASLVRPGGYLFVSGVNLDLRSRLALEYGWKPVTRYLEEVHAGDETMTMDWPFERWGLEPLDRRRADWRLRYCAVFQMP